MYDSEIERIGEIVRREIDRLFDGRLDMEELVRGFFRDFRSKYVLGGGDLDNIIHFPDAKDIVGDENGVDCVRGISVRQYFKTVERNEFYHIERTGKTRVRSFRDVRKLIENDLDDSLKIMLKGVDEGDKEIARKYGDIVAIVDRVKRLVVQYMPPNFPIRRVDMGC